MGDCPNLQLLLLPPLVLLRCCWYSLFVPPVDCCDVSVASWLLGGPDGRVVRVSLSRLPKWKKRCTSTRCIMHQRLLLLTKPLLFWYAKWLIVVCYFLHWLIVGGVRGAWSSCSMMWGWEKFVMDSLFALFNRPPPVRFIVCCRGSRTTAVLIRQMVNCCVLIFSTG